MILISRQEGKNAGNAEGATFQPQVHSPVQAVWRQGRSFLIGQGHFPLPSIQAATAPTTADMAP